MSAKGARFLAKQQGEDKYLGEKPCKSGHTGLRVTATGTCIECRRLNSLKKYHSNPKEAVAKVQKYYEKNAEKVKAKRREHYAKNSEKEKAIAKVRSAEWRKLNPDHEGTKIAKKKYSESPIGKVKKALGVSKRRASLINRMPIWLTDDDLWMMEQAYELAKTREKLFGFKWHVDHILPLNGKEVSGFHIPENLQVIPWMNNLKKSNHFYPNLGKINTI